MVKDSIAHAHQMIIEILERFFGWNTKPTSSEEAKRRLKFVIAHDRASISSDMLESMRKEILEVVARYVEIDREEMEFTLENNNRITALVANLPIRQIKRMTTAEKEKEERETEIEGATENKETKPTNSSP